MTSIGWHTGLSAADRHRILGVIAAATAEDGVAPVGEQVVRALPQDDTRHLLAVGDGPLGDDSVVGYLNLAPSVDGTPAVAELVVHPGARRQGLGSSMTRIGLAEGGSGARIWAHGNLAPARALADALGLVAVRKLLQMRRPLTELPAVTIPAGVRITVYSGPGDDAELIRVNNAAFAWHPEQGGWTADDIVQRRGEPWFDPNGLFLAVDEHTGALLGFHWTKVHDTNPGEGLGEVYVVGVDPAAQGRGLGSTLTLVGLHHLANRLQSPHATVMLYVEADNLPAVKTYRTMGFEVFSTDVAYGANASAGRCNRRTC